MDIRSFTRIAYLESHLPRAEMRTNRGTAGSRNGPGQIALQDVILRVH